MVHDMVTNDYSDFRVLPISPLLRAYLPPHHRGRSASAWFVTMHHKPERGLALHPGGDQCQTGRRLDLTI